MTRNETLDKAMKCVCGERQDQYGTPENNFTRIANLWTAYLDFKISPVDVAMMMALLKIARVKTGTATDDSFVDLAGYAACGAEIRETLNRSNRCVCCDAEIPEGRQVCPKCEREASWNNE